MLGIGTRRDGGGGQHGAARWQQCVAGSMLHAGSGVEAPTCRGVCVCGVTYAFTESWTIVISKLLLVILPTYHGCIETTPRPAGVEACKAIIHSMG